MEAVESIRVMWESRKISILENHGRLAEQCYVFIRSMERSGLKGHAFPTHPAAHGGIQDPLGRNVVMEEPSNKAKL